MDLGSPYPECPIRLTKARCIQLLCKPECMVPNYGTVRGDRMKSQPIPPLLRPPKPLFSSSNQWKKNLVP